jgi:hypothetical protein
MSTIALTPTHIAQDHTVGSVGIPITLTIDPKHPKLFISQDNTFIIGMTGIYDPVNVRDDLFLAEMSKLLDLCSNRDKRGYIDTPRFMDEIIMDTMGTNPMFLVSKTQRVVVKKWEESDGSKSRIGLYDAGEYACLGAGDLFMEGALAGGASLAEAYAIGNRYDFLTSKTFTAIALSDLDDREVKS